MTNNLSITDLKKQIQTLMKKFELCCIDYDITENDTVTINIEGVATIVLYSDNTYKLTKFEEI